MKQFTHLASALVLGTVYAHPWGPPGYPSTSKAVYFLRVDPSGSSIVAIDVGSNGLLGGKTSVTSTGGDGLQSQNFTSPTLAPTAFDPLQGQQAVSIGNDYLFTINSGSDTAVMFAIDPSDPLNLHMVGQPAPTLGQFAMSIAYSTKYQKACVLNGGAVNGVTCYSVSSEQGLVPDGVGLRKLGLPATTPPQLGGPSGSGSDIQFSIDSSKLIVTFKGTSTEVGHVIVYDVSEDGAVAKKGVDSRPSSLTVPFGFALNGNDKTQLYLSNAAAGGVLASLDYTSNTISVVSVINETTSAASCWAVWSPTTNTYYDINAASPNIGEVNTAGQLVNLLTYKKKLGGAFDSVAAGDKLYSLTATNAIAVFDIAGSGKLEQVYHYGSISDRPHWTGMAMYPSDPVLSGGL